MAKDVKHEAAKAITKLGRQQEWRKVVGELRDAAAEVRRTGRTPSGLNRGTR